MPRPALIPASILFALLIGGVLRGGPASAGPPAASPGPADAWSTPGLTAMSPEEQARVLAALQKRSPQLKRLLAMGVEGPGEKTSRAAEDRSMQDQLRDLAGALKDLERAVVNQGSGSSLVLGLAYEHLGAAIGGAHVPSYLTEAQAEVYRDALADKRAAQDDLAGQAYRKVVTDAAAADPDRWPAFDAPRLAATRLQALAIRNLSCGLLDFDAGAHAQCEQATAPARAAAAQRAEAEQQQQRALLALLDQRTSTLEDAINALRDCPDALPDGAAEDAQIILEQANSVLDSQEFNIVNDILVFVEDAIAQLSPLKERCRTQPR